ncbi:MAG: hypothetical protein R2791_06275 [Saprospiraceae bacterium]
MKEIITQLNPAFDHRNRLGIMSILAVNDWVEYNTLKVFAGLYRRQPRQPSEGPGKRRIYQVRNMSGAASPRPPMQ